MQNFIATDDGEILAQALAVGNAIAVCDGSYKQGKGASAWVIEGESSEGRIKGFNGVPGSTVNQSSYRSELAGLLGIVSFTVELCKYHSIKEATITIACDNLSALSNSLDSDNYTSIQDPDHDLIIAIQKLLLSPGITWLHRHVRGHQDDKKDSSALDRWEKLNIEMDALAKRTLSQPHSLPSQTSKGEPWSIWINKEKIIKDIANNIYEHIHGKEAIDYWLRKEKLNSETCSLMAWDSIGKAITQTPLPRRWFLSKHISGMCGVGKFTTIWKDTETATCPRCGDYEDAPHVWRCKDKAVQLIWDSQLDKLHSWLATIDTDPEIITVIIMNLKSWYYNTPTEVIDTSRDIQNCAKRQDLLGWDLVIEGFLHYGWIDSQQRYYDSIGSRRTGKKWLERLLLELWDLTMLLWINRNDTKHQQDNQQTSREITHMNRNIICLYNKLNGTVPNNDQYLFITPLPTLLKKTMAFKLEWIAQATAVSEAQLKRLSQPSASNAITPTVMAQMRNTMAAWLTPRQHDPSHGNNLNSHEG
jgi:hypothetical protein